MEPKTKIQKRVYELSKSLPGITKKHRDWAIENCFDHYYVYRKTKNVNICVDCGHTWKAGEPVTTCPQCKAKLTLAKSSLKSKFKDNNYYSVIQSYKEFTVIRIFYIEKFTYIGKSYDSGSLYEVSQYWYDDKGRHAIMSKGKAIYTFYRETPFLLYSDMCIKAAHNRYRYISPYYVYPKSSVGKVLKRNGFRQSFRGFAPEFVIENLIKEPIYETLWKQNDTELLKIYYYNSSRIKQYWKQILKLKKRNCEVKDINLWFDYLDLLSFFKKDLNNPHYLFPDDLRLEHDKYMEKKRRYMERERQIRERENQRQRLEQEKEKIERFIQTKGKYFNITFRNDNFVIVVLSSIEAYKHEGDTLHHCVFTNTYYDRPNSLILSARKVNDLETPIETIELSLKNGEIIQCYGSHNQETEYHNEIISLVEQNAYRVLSA